MNKAGLINVISAAIGFGWGILVGASFMHHARTDQYQSKAIEHNCAEYNPSSGKFEWRKNGNVQAR